nr:hypothetical protein [Patescibacteria group bacterium]
YNDQNCYPTSIPFGSLWEVSTVVYMKQVPQARTCSSNPSSCYEYINTGSCPQWNVVFAKLSKIPTSSACALSSLTSCTPHNYDSSWACAISGTVDCSYLSTVDLASGSANNPTPTPSGGGSSGPTPTPTPTPCAPLNYACTGSPPACNVVPSGTGQYCTAACGGAC